MAASANLLDCFWALSSTAESERLTATKDLLEILRIREVSLAAICLLVEVEARALPLMWPGASYFPRIK